MKKVILATLMLICGFLLTGPHRVTAQERPPAKGELAPYLAKVHAAVSAKLGSKTASDARELHGMAGSPAEGAHMANGLWVFGSTAYAILVLGNTLQTDPQNADYLNNYAAFLTMAGAGEAALPILKYLNAAYPRNSTVLNNLAQAWFGLGDITTAEAYLDSTLALYPGHSQANLTKSMIEEHKGNKTEAVKALKESIKSGYSPYKEKKIKESGYKPTPNDLTWIPPFNEDPLGLGHMNWPKYPLNVSQSNSLEREWNDYRENINSKMDDISQKMEMLTEQYEELMENPLERFGGRNMNSPVVQLVYAPKIQALRDYYETGNGELELRKYNEVMESEDKLQTAVYLIEEEFNQKMMELIETMGDRMGEGSSQADMEAYCHDEDALKSAYLLKVNTLLETENAKKIDYWRKAISWRINYARYTLLPEEFELELLRNQGIWLGMVSGQEVRFANPCVIHGAEERLGLVSGKLRDFYDLTCKETSHLNLIIGSITIECNKMTTKLDSKFFKYTIRENMDTDEIIHGTVEFGFDPNLTNPAEWGPVKAELKAEIYGFIEFDGNGITDVGVKAGAKATFGTNYVSDNDAIRTLGFADDQSLTLVGAETRWGWNSGPSMEGKGILQGMSTNFK